MRTLSHSDWTGIRFMDNQTGYIEAYDGRGNTVAKWGPFTKAEAPARLVELHKDLVQTESSLRFDICEEDDETASPEIPDRDEQLVGMDVIIISDTEEPGAFDRTSGVAVVQVEYGDVVRWSVLGARLEDHGDFAELRLWGSYATFHEHHTPEALLEALSSIPDVERNAKEGPRITREEVSALRDHYEENGFFIWPSDQVEFDLLTIVNMAALVNNESQSEDEPEWLSVEIEEVVIADKEFRCAAYVGDQQVHTKPVAYSQVLDQATS